MQTICRGCESLGRVAHSHIGVVRSMNPQVTGTMHTTRPCHECRGRGGVRFPGVRVSGRIGTIR